MAFLDWLFGKKRAKPARPRQPTRPRQPSRPRLHAPAPPRAANKPGAAGPLVPFDAKQTLIPIVKCTGEYVELKSSKEITRIDFDYRRRCLLAPHNFSNLLDDCSAWKMDAWTPTTFDWGLDAAFVTQHELTRALGGTLEIECMITNGPSEVRGRYLHIKIRKPIEAFNFTQQVVHLIWDVEQRQWISAVVANIMAFPSYWASQQHLAMWQGMQGNQVLRMMPLDHGGKGDLASAPFTLHAACQGLSTTPDGQCIVTNFGPSFEKNQVVKPLSLAAYAPYSTKAHWQHTYNAIPHSENAASWFVSDVTLTKHRELISIATCFKDPSHSFYLLDLVKGRALSKPLCLESKLVATYGMVTSKGLIALCRVPNILEVLQLGRQEPVVLSVELPDAATSPVTGYLCPQGNYLAIVYKQENIIRVYSFTASLPVTPAAPGGQRMPIERVANPEKVAPSTGDLPSTPTEASQPAIEGRIRFACPKCQKVLSASPEHASKKGRCKHCGERITIPLKQ